MYYYLQRYADETAPWWHFPVALVIGTIVVWVLLKILNSKR